MDPSPQPPALHASLSPLRKPATRAAPRGAPYFTTVHPKMRLARISWSDIVSQRKSEPRRVDAVRLPKRAAKEAPCFHMVLAFMTQSHDSNPKSTTWKGGASSLDVRTLKINPLHPRPIVSRHHFCSASFTPSCSSVCCSISNISSFLRALPLRRALPTSIK